MLTKFVMNLIKQDPETFNDLIWHYEQILCCEFENTYQISKYIYNVFKNANIIYYNDAKSEKENESGFIKYVNKIYETNYKTIKEIQDDKNINIVRGDKIYAILW